MTTVQIKVCGVTSIADAHACAGLGADMIGLNFFRGSSRYIAPERAREVVAAVADQLRAVGVFVDADVEEIREVARQTGIAAVQLHGKATPEMCAELAQELDVIRALNTSADFEPANVSDWKACDILLDAHHPRLRGGTGTVCDWEAARKARLLTRFLILSGGLNSANVAEAIATVRPDAVDVCSGVESAPGVKNHDAVAQFITAVRAAT